jgi:CO/xanthine dehydrogenase Mo-binding subunit
VYRNQCAALLGMDISKLRVTASEIGGGFGGKTHIWTEPLALALSRKANRPVKLTMSREEVFRCSGPTSSTSIDMKIGAKKDGTITAAHGVLRYHGGAFPATWAEFGAMTAFACYDLKNVKSESIEHRQAYRIRPWRRREGLQGSRRRHRAQLQNRADAPGLYRAPCLPRQCRP